MGRDVIDPLFDGEDDAATPLTVEEREQLIPTYITNRAELNEAEQLGIAAADRWAFNRTRNILDIAFLLALHKRMFGDVWRWAGEVRTTARNIGIDAHRIIAELGQRIDDAQYWIDQQIYDPDEIAIRFHHRLTQIHPFPNGNGRFARLAADLLVVKLGRDRFSWGRKTLADIGETRRHYVEALRAADRNEIASLLAFGRL